MNTLFGEEDNKGKEDKLDCTKEKKVKK